MANPSPTPQPSLQLFFETVNAFHRTAALKAAIELDLFTAIGEGVETPQALAARTKASERGVRILCDYLAVAGFLTKAGGRYNLTLDSRTFLDRRSPGYVGGALEFLLSPTLTDAFRELTAAVRQGSTALGQDGIIAPEHPGWVKFARAMAPVMRMPAELVAKLLGAEAGKKWKVLDIAAGHGLYGITIGRLNSNAEIVALDWQNVLPVAQENAREAGLGNRFRTIAGSAFETDFGKDYDVVLLTNILHHFDVAACESLLRKVSGALKPGGRAVLLEFVPNDDRVTPPVAAQFSMMMLATTPAGDAYTFSELDRMLRNAGFRSSQLHELPPTFFRVVIGQT